MTTTASSTGGPDPDLNPDPGRVDSHAAGAIDGDYDTTLRLLEQHRTTGLPDDLVWAAFETYMSAHEADVHRYIEGLRGRWRGITTTNETAADLSAATFTKLWQRVAARRFNPYDPDGGDRGLLYRIARNHWSDYVTQQRSHPAISLDGLAAASEFEVVEPKPAAGTPGHGSDIRDPTWDAVNDQLARQQLDDLANAAGLTPEEHAVLVIGYELTVTQPPPADLVAAILGLEATENRTPAEQVHDLRYHAKRKLRAFLADHPDANPRNDGRQ